MTQFKIGSGREFLVQKNYDILYSIVTIYSWLYHFRRNNSPRFPIIHRPQLAMIPLFSSAQPLANIHGSILKINGLVSNVGFSVLSILIPVEMGSPSLLPHYIILLHPIPTAWINVVVYMRSLLESTFASALYQHGIYFNQQNALAVRLPVFLQLDFRSLRWKFLPSRRRFKTLRCCLGVVPFNQRREGNSFDQYNNS